MSDNYSVLMSIYEREKPEYLRESIRSMVEQTIPPNDFVIVCDGILPNELYDVLDEFKLKYPCINIIRRDKNTGLACALSAGLEHCKNDIVARMDSDDIAFPDRMKIQLEILKNKNADIVSGTVAEFDKNINNILKYKELPETNIQIQEYAVHRNPFNHPCTVFRCHKVIEAGGYQECQWFEDYYLWLRMLKIGCVGYNTAKPVLYMRAGKEMYSRRGGIKYTICALKFRCKAFTEHYCSFFDLIYTGIAHIAVGLVPNKLRIYIYSRFLRRTENK